jgi:hypothetical protein
MNCKDAPIANQMNPARTGRFTSIHVPTAAQRYPTRMKRCAIRHTLPVPC